MALLREGTQRRFDTEAAWQRARNTEVGHGATGLAGVAGSLVRCDGCAPGGGGGGRTMSAILARVLSKKHENLNEIR